MFNLGAFALSELLVRATGSENNLRLAPQTTFTIEKRSGGAATIYHDEDLTDPFAGADFTPLYSDIEGWVPGGVSYKLTFQTPTFEDQVVYVEALVSDWVVDRLEGIELTAEDIVFSGSYVETGMTAGEVTTALQQGLDDAVAQGKPFVWAGGEYPTLDTLYWNGDSGMIICSQGRHPVVAGDQGERTVLQPPAGVDGIVLGTGLPYGVPTGVLQGLTVMGPAACPTDGKAGIKLKGLSRFRVEDCHVTNADIGFDQIGNCYGSEWHNCSTSENTVNVGWNVRHGDESGNDLLAHACWFRGEVAAVSISPHADGIRIVGGQLLGPQSLAAPDDDKAALLLGKDYLTDSVAGNVGKVVLETSIEGTEYAWGIRSYTPLYSLAVRDVQFLANHTNPMIGLAKLTNFQNSVLKLERSTVIGEYSNPELLVIEGEGTAPQVEEDGSIISATVDGDLTIGFSILQQSQVSGTVISRDVTGQVVEQKGDELERIANDRIERSSDWGDTWEPERSRAWGSDELLDLSAVTGVADGTGVGVGDKIDLYSSGSTFMGFGVQASRLVAAIPSGSSFAVRTSSGVGDATSGTEVFKVDTNGLVENSSRVDAHGGFRAMGPVHPVAGEGVEITWSTAFHIGYVQAYDWSGAVYKPLNIQGSEISLNYGTTPRIIVDSNGIGLDAPIYHPLDLSAAYGNYPLPAGTATGDKVSFYSTGATFFGMGVQASRLVAAVPAGSSFAVRQSSASGDATSGTEVFSVAADGKAVGTALWDNAGIVRSTAAPAFPGSGAGVELYYSSGGWVGAYNRGASTYQPMTVWGSSVDLQTSGTSRLKVDGTGVGFFAHATAAQPSARTLSNWSSVSNSLYTIDRNSWTNQQLFDFVMTMAYNFQQNGMYA